MTGNNGSKDGDEGDRLFGDIFLSGSCSVNGLRVFSPVQENLSDILMNQLFGYKY